jgi:hypothetical protein
MPEMLLINPRKRTRRKAVRKTVARRRRNPIAKASRSRRALNPVRAIRPRAVSAIRRRKNPVSLLRRRRRNPIKIGTTASGIMGMVKEALIGGAGSIGVDLAYGYIAPMLPASLQRTPGRVGVGDAVKAVATVLIGNVLSKPTRGLSVKMAKGALTVQATEILRTFVPASSLEEQWDLPALERVLRDEWQLDVALASLVEQSDSTTDEDIVDKVVVAADQVFEGKLAVVGQRPFSRLLQVNG